MSACPKSCAAAERIGMQKEGAPVGLRLPGLLTCTWRRCRACVRVHRSVLLPWSRWGCVSGCDVCCGGKMRCDAQTNTGYDDRSTPIAVGHVWDLHRTAPSHPKEELEHAMQVIPAPHHHSLLHCQGYLRHPIDYATTPFSVAVSVHEDGAGDAGQVEGV